MKKEFTLTIFSENRTGILNRIVTTITRRHINIESISVSASSMEGIHRYTIMLILTDEEMRKLATQIDKQVDVLKVFYYENEEIVYQEIALYKIPTHSFFNGEKVEGIIRKFNARILVVESDYIVIEKTGHPEDTEALLDKLKESGVYEFVRSGRVAIPKTMERLNTYLKSLETGSDKGESLH
jgi:acetolactate synthase-1/3 small subunit